MGYPKVLSERETIQRAIDGASLARYGDGELSLATGGNCISQKGNPEIAAELREILIEVNGNLLPCIPNAFAKGTKPTWKNYATDKFTALYGPREYGSSFVTRPDSAPWIDDDEYWALVAQIWTDKDVTLITGGKNGLRESQLHGVGTVREIHGPWTDAYGQLPWLHREIGKAPGLVLMSLGPCATVLAARLCRAGHQAIDLGHIGMFMRHIGAYRFKLDNLISDKYRAMLIELRQTKKGWGGDGAKHAKEVLKLRMEWECMTILDYGCGTGGLEKAVHPIRVSGFDPGVVGKEGMPKPCDLVVCSDVLEHVEADKLGNVLDHIYRLSGVGAYIVISTRPAIAALPNGQNAHLVIEDAAWWCQTIQRRTRFMIEKTESPDGRELRLWLKK